MTDYLVPGLLFVIAAWALGRGQQPYTLLLEGAAQGLALLRSIVPSLIVLLSAVAMLRTSGAAEQLSRWAAPVFSFFGIPPETALLVLIRPFSGSAALAVGAELMGRYGVDSPVGRTAAVMLGSTIPPETALLVLIRPFSGSAALAVGAELMGRYGVDSPVGRTAAVMLGSTETTFYTISVYFGAAGIQKTRYTIPAALFADFVGFFMASLTVRWFFGG